MWWPWWSLPVVYTADPTHREWRESSSDHIWYDSHWKHTTHTDKTIYLISLTRSEDNSNNQCLNWSVWLKLTWTGPAWSTARPAITCPSVSDKVPSTSGPGSCHLDETLTGLKEIHVIWLDLSNSTVKDKTSTATTEIPLTDKYTTASSAYI